MTIVNSWLIGMRMRYLIETPCPIVVVACARVYCTLGFDIEVRATSPKRADAG